MQMTLPLAKNTTPCENCSKRPDCSAFLVLNDLIYQKSNFKRATSPTSFLQNAGSEELYASLQRTIKYWMESVKGLHAPQGEEYSLSALFDFLASGLYAYLLHSEATPGLLTKPAYLHSDNTQTLAFFPYVWMCPGCITEGRDPREAYLAESELRSGKRYAVSNRLSRPNGRMIGDLGALVIRALVSELAEGAYVTTGGGHRGEFDLVIATAERLILGEIKASPLVAFPLVASQPFREGAHHSWATKTIESDDWAFFVGAANPGERKLPISPPSDKIWPLKDLEAIAQNPERVRIVLDAWQRHLVGYRLFNDEDQATRWLRFGCGNIESRDPQSGQREQLRVDNTKSLPGIDRTDDIKKGIAQVMLFGRLKRGCSQQAIKTALFGNLYAETHHEHYMKPLASLQLLWPNADPVYLFDAILGLSRNIINDDGISELFGLPNTPYEADTVDAAALVQGLEEISE
ncbi:hypothetical protein [Streptomyces sp. NBC_01508]|uniref:hypothetical protein n=1 Tax=Streptomyces sp. NBC_01508 TaxID=2903888 RepID=UPI003862E485